MTISRRTARLALGALVSSVLAFALVLASQAAVHKSLVSRNSQGSAANGQSETIREGSISHDGRLVAFGSVAANLPGGDGVTRQAYVRDLTNGKTRLMSTKANGGASDGDVFAPAISFNGRFVAFAGLGTGLPGANGSQQVWVHDRKTGKTRLASKANDGQPGDGPSFTGWLNADGRFVLFTSAADNLPAGNGVNAFVYVRDLEKGKTILVSRTNAGSPVEGSLDNLSISANGRRVVFESSSPSLPGGDGMTRHSYLRDLKQHKTKRVDRNSNGVGASDFGDDPSISASGRFVTFESWATNLPAGDGFNLRIYLRDLKRGTTKLVSRNSAGQPANGLSHAALSSGNARYVVFGSTATNLPGGDGLNEQVYLRDMRKGTTRLVSKTAGGDPGSDDSNNSSISVDGRFAAFYSDADNLGGNPLYSNVFRFGL